MNDDRCSDDQTEENWQQDGRYEQLPQIEFLDVGHADRLVVARARALCHRQMPNTNGDQALDSLSVTMSREFAREWA